MQILFYLLISLGINIFLFIPAFIFKTDKLTDLSYAISFIALIFTSIFLTNARWQNILITSIVTIWALRLGIFLFIRIHKMKKDKRFDGMRESFFKFLQFWLLQGLAVWVILLPAIIFMDTTFAWFCYGGLLIWIIGLSIETTADIQKFRFSRNKSNKNKFIQTGIWKYSRHPNYFGEILCWVGIYILVFPNLSNLQRLIGSASPIFITTLLLFVSGIPILEKYADQKWGKQKDYKEYKRKTSILIPWFQKK